MNRFLKQSQHPYLSEVQPGLINKLTLPNIIKKTIDIITEPVTNIPMRSVA